MRGINAKGGFPFESLRFRKVDGVDDLLLAIVQDFRTNEILMIAYTNIEAIEKTIETKKMHYFSTSRKRLWLKGESSGNFQAVKEVYIDCDGDALLFKVEQMGGACHTGYRSCFFRRIDDEGIKVVGEKVFNPEEVY
jgi:phosphoribosyl-AMP cyclohydrolase